MSLTVIYWQRKEVWEPVATRNDSDHQRAPACLGSHAVTVKADAVQSTSKGEIHIVSSSEDKPTTFHDPDIICKDNDVEGDGDGGKDKAEEKRQRYLSPGLFMVTAWVAGCHRFVMIV